LKNRFALAGVALAAVAFAGGAYAATQSGSNSRQEFINDVAHRLNVSPDQLRAAFKGALIDRLNAAVKEGRLTQAQANAIERRINQGQVPLPLGPHRGFGHGGFGHEGFRHGGPGLSAAASYLGITDAQLFDQLRSGKSLAQIAKDKGKTTAGLEAAISAAFKARLDKAVAAGRITKAQEQTVLNRFQSRLDQRVNQPGLKPRHLHSAHDGPAGAPGRFEGPPPAGAPGGFEGPPPPPPAA
jgi:AraC-like DNA-binding protein